MINSGERVAVGVSGGKDSMTLLTALHRLSRFYPKSFDVVGIMLDLGFEGADSLPIAEYAEREGIELHIIKTNIADIVFKARSEPNPCSLCARMRRGALHNEALKLGINKIALGHHADDAVETLMMNLFFEGRLGCYSPVTYLDRKGVTVIRPLLYVEEKDIRNVVKKCGIPVMHNPCPANGNTERTGMKELITGLEKSYPGVKQRMFGALQRSELDGWHEFPKGRKTPEDN